MFNPESFDLVPIYNCTYWLIFLLSGHSLEDARKYGWNFDERGILGFGWFLLCVLLSSKWRESVACLLSQRAVLQFKLETA